MNKLLRPILLLSIVFTSFTPAVYAAMPSVYYQILSDAYLYRTLDLIESDAYFILPPTYFVKLNYEVDETTLAVSYLGYEGFVKKSDVKRVYSTPAHPYLENVTFCPNEVANLVLRAKPSTQSAYLGTIPYTANEIAYIGSIPGEEVYPSLPPTWYFCKYRSIEQGNITGYVYAPLTKNLSPILPNTDQVNFEPIVSTSAEISLSPELQSSSNVCIM